MRSAAAAGRKGRAGVLLLALAVVLLGGCGADSRSPAEVATAFFEACNRGDYEQAESLASAGLKQQLQSGLGSVFGGFEGYCDFHTRSGNLLEVEALDEQVQGQRAQVVLGFRFRPGSSTPGNFGDEEDAFKDTWPMSHAESGWKVASPDY